MSTRNTSHKAKGPTPRGSTDISSLTVRTIPPLPPPSFPTTRASASRPTPLSEVGQASASTVPTNLDHMAAVAILLQAAEASEASEETSIKKPSLENIMNPTDLDPFHARRARYPAHDPTPNTVPAPTATAAPASAHGWTAVNDQTNTPHRTATQPTTRSRKTAPDTNQKKNTLAARGKSKGKALADKKEADASPPKAKLSALGTSLAVKTFFNELKSDGTPLRPISPEAQLEQCKDLLRRNKIQFDQCAAASIWGLEAKACPDNDNPSMVTIFEHLELPSATDIFEMTHRKCISQYVGRNKIQTKKIKKWIWSHRKCYQKGSYRWTAEYAQFVYRYLSLQLALNDLEFEKIEYGIKLKTLEQKRLDRYKESKSTVNSDFKWGMSKQIRVEALEEFEEFLLRRFPKPVGVAIGSNVKRQGKNADKDHDPRFQKLSTLECFEVLAKAEQIRESEMQKAQKKFKPEDMINLYVEEGKREPKMAEPVLPVGIAFELIPVVPENVQANEFVFEPARKSLGQYPFNVLDLADHIKTLDNGKMGRLIEDSKKRPGQDRWSKLKDPSESRDKPLSDVYVGATKYGLSEEVKKRLDWAKDRLNDYYSKEKDDNSNVYKARKETKSKDQDDGDGDEGDDEGDNEGLAHEEDPDPPSKKHNRSEEDELEADRPVKKSKSKKTRQAPKQKKPRAPRGAAKARVQQQDQDDVKVEDFDKPLSPQQPISPAKTRGTERERSEDLDEASPEPSKASQITWANAPPRKRIRSVNTTRDAESSTDTSGTQAPAHADGPSKGRKRSRVIESDDSDSDATIDARPSDDEEDAEDFKRSKRRKVRKISRS